jgi:hypothetical protein
MRSTIKVLDQESAASTGLDPIHTVYVTFQEASLGRMTAPPTTPKGSSNSSSNHKEISNSSTWIPENQLIDLFESIGSDLPQMEHLIIQFVPIQPELRNNNNNNNNNKTKNRFHMKKSSKKAAPELPMSVAIPPVQAITSVLMESNHLLSICLIGLRLTGDKFDVNGLLEALRIHPRLEAFLMHGCWFTNEENLETIRRALKVSSSSSSSSSSPNSGDIGSGSFSVGSDSNNNGTGIPAPPPTRLKHVDLRDNVVIDRYGNPIIYNPSTTAASTHESRDRERYDEESQQGGEDDCHHYESSHNDLDENVNTSNTLLSLGTTCAPLRMGSSTSKNNKNNNIINTKGKNIETKNKGGPTDRYFLEQEAKDQTKTKNHGGASVASSPGADEEEMEEGKLSPTSFLSWCMSPLMCCQ